MSRDVFLAAALGALLGLLVRPTSWVRSDAMNETARVQQIVNDITFPGYRFTVGTAWLPTDERGPHGLPVEKEAAVVRVVYDEPDVMTGVNERQEGRPWLITPQADAGQIARTCLKAVLTSLEHRAREHMTYKGRAVFNPHLSIDQMLAQAPEREHAAPAIAFDQ